MTIPFRVNLKDQVAVITGGGGILCSIMAKALAECGAKVAILDLKPDMAQKAAEYADDYIKGKRDFQQKVPVKVDLVTKENVSRYGDYGKK